jgi:hypothetical protein
MIELMSKRRLKTKAPTSTAFLDSPVAEQSKVDLLLEIYE